jgi:hypothetical protein
LTVISSVRVHAMYVKKLTTVDGIGLLVRDLNAEFLTESATAFALLKHQTNLLNGHDDLYGVKAVETQVVVEV